MQERIALSPSDLRESTLPITEHLPETLHEALVHLFVSHVNTQLRSDRENEFMGVDEKKPEPDVADHYFYHFDPGLVNPSIPIAVADHFRMAGWPETEIKGGMLVIARKKYVADRGTRPPGAPVLGRVPHMTDSYAHQPVA